jgi:hypothetical protein
LHGLIGVFDSLGQYIFLPFHQYPAPMILILPCLFGKTYRHDPAFDLAEAKESFFICAVVQKTRLAHYGRFVYEKGGLLNFEQVLIHGLGTNPCGSIPLSNQIFYRQRHHWKEGVCIPIVSGVIFQ